MRIPVTLALLMAVSGCVEVPELDRSITEEARLASYPELIPVETIRAEVPEARIAQETGPDLQARAEALQRRADGLRRGPVVDAPTRARMEQGVPH